MLVDRDIDILKALARYFVLNRVQIQSLIFPQHKNPRVTRRRLQFLHEAGLINRQNVQTLHVGETMPSQVYFLKELGCTFLARRFEDDSYLLCPTRSPAAHHVQHWLAVSDTHILFNSAIAKKRDIQLDGWLNEWDVANKSESNPENHYRLYTVIRDNPKLVCVPDAAFLLSKDGHKKIHYIEQDRATTGPEQIAARKCQGYAALAEGNMHTRHFPETTLASFSVLMIAPTNGRREALRKALRGKPGADLWRFVATPDMKPETLFSAPIFYPSEGEPRPLVKQKEAT